MQVEDSGTTIRTCLNEGGLALDLNDSNELSIPLHESIGWGTDTAHHVMVTTPAGKTWISWTGRQQMAANADK
jgi:hypothetical protein